MPSNKNIFIVTGANSGLGLEATRQLALMAETKKVYMSCRTSEKANEAISTLINEHGIPSSKLAFMEFVGGDDKETIVANAMHAISDGEQIDGIILNAGGPGSDLAGKPTGPNNIMDQIQINLVGHLHLVEGLKDANMLKPNETRIVFAGSEAARGAPTFGVPAPKLPSTSKDMQKVVMGTHTKKFDAVAYYATAKGVSALYFSEWARHNPEYFVLTISPGATTGTKAPAQKAFPAHMRVMAPKMMKVFKKFSMAHGVSKGAKRYVDGVLGINGFNKFTSGTFVASTSGLSGPVSDQSLRKEPRASQYGDINKQVAAYEVIQAYM